jgi:arylformamidase
VSSGGGPGTGSGGPGSGWIDVSVPIRHGMVHWPNNPPVEVARVKDMAHGGSSNVSRLALGVHTGTHVDAPVHFDSAAGGVDTLALDALVGPARVIAIADPVHVDVAELAAAGVAAGERILLKTRNSPAAWAAPSFVEDAVHLTEAAARYLAAQRVRTVGIDYLSVGGYRAKNGAAVHHALLGGGVTIIEGLDLSQVEPGPVDLVCLPLRIEGGDGAPARAIVRPRS